MQNLLQKFSDDIRFGCHSTHAEYCRSNAAGEILKMDPRAALQATVGYLENFAFPEGNRVEQNVELALLILVHDLAREMRDEIPLNLIEQGILLGEELVIMETTRSLDPTVPQTILALDRSAWIAWAKMVVNSE